MTDAELTILSLLAEGARYGHEVQQLIDERGLREWLTIGFSSVFYVLNKLERQKMIHGELRPNGHMPARKYYRLTEAGRGILQTSVSNLLREPRALGSGFELGLANLHVLKPAQVYMVLSHHRQDLIRQIDAIRQAWARQQNDNGDIPPNISALYTHSLSRMQADIEWLTAFLEDWRTHYPGVEKPPTDDRRPLSSATDLPKRTTPDTLKMIQKLKRVKPDDTDEETD